jgi:hypothetical protein
VGDQHDGLAARRSLIARTSAASPTSSRLSSVRPAPAATDRRTWRGPGPDAASGRRTGRRRRRPAGCRSLRRCRIRSCTPARLAACTTCSASTSPKRAMFSDRAGKQFYILRQVAQVRAQLVLIPLVDIGAIEAHLPTGRPHADQQTRQRRLATAARAHMPSTSPAPMAKLTPFSTMFLLPAPSRSPSTDTVPVGGQRHAGHAPDSRSAACSGAHRRCGCCSSFSHANHLLHRRQRAAHQDRGGNHHAGEILSPAPAVRQSPAPAIAARSGRTWWQRRRCRPSRWPVPAGAGTRMQLEPALHQVGQHAHGFDHFGIAQVIGRQLARHDRHGVGFGQRARVTRSLMARHQHRRAAQREHAQRRLKMKITIR